MTIMVWDRMDDLMLELESTSWGRNKDLQKL